MSLPILALLRDPSVVRGWSPSQWADVLPRLSACGMLGHVDALFAANGIDTTSFPAAVQRQLLAGKMTSDAQLRSLRWEIGELAGALRQVGVPAVLMFGADYLLRDALPARGRMLQYLDLLLRPADLDQLSNVLGQAGWPTYKIPPGFVSDQLPTMIHPDRQTLLKIRYHLLGEGNAVAFDLPAVLDRIVPIDAGPFSLLAPEDAVIAGVSHLIRNSRVISSFRDLLDLRELVGETASADTRFGHTLIARSEEFGMASALSRASRDMAELFGTSGSVELDAWARRQRAAPGGGSALALIPDGASRPSLGVRAQRIGRLMARTRSVHPTRSTVAAMYSVMFGEAGDAAK